MQKKYIGDSRRKSGGYAGMACCKDLVKEIDKVHAAYADLMKRLAAKAPKTAKPAK